jgi:hypothetical protein
MARECCIQGSMAFISKLSAECVSKQPLVLCTELARKVPLFLVPFATSGIVQ